MLRSKWMICLLAVIVATVSIAVVPHGVSADDDPAGLLGIGPGPMCPGAMFKKFLAGTPLGRHIAGSVGRGLVLISELNVTDEQKEQIRDVIVGHKAEIVEVVKTLHARKCALRDAVMAEELDESAIRKAADELGSAIGDAAVGKAKLRGEIAPILTDEQRALIKKFHAEQRESVEKLLAEWTEDK